MRLYILFFLSVLSVAIVIEDVSAKEGQKSLGTYGLWQTYTYNENNQQVCYMVKAIHFPVSKHIKRGPAFLMITERPLENSVDVVSYNAGYNLKVGSEVKVTIAKENFSLFTDKDTAWSRDTKTDQAITLAISHNDNMKVVSFPAQKDAPAITDSLDLTGSHAAYQAISKACGLEVEAPTSTPPSHSKKTK